MQRGYSGRHQVRQGQRGKNGLREGTPRADGDKGRKDDLLPLVVRAQQGDAVAWEELYHKLVPAVWGVAKGLLLEQEVEDAVQEALAAVWQAIQSFKGASEFRTFVHVIAVRKCLEIRENRQRRQKRLAEWAVIMGKKRCAPDPEEKIEEAELRDMVRRCLSELGARDRAVLTLRYSSNMSYEEVGEVLGCTGKAAKQKCFRARNTLRGCLEREMGRRKK
jgi:RNA polymerase sigma-70 factor (ECF subfamily)